MLKVVAVFDQAIGSFNRPVFVPALGAAVRGFTDEVRREDSELARHPQDYQLFELGEWDEQSGRFSMLDQPRRIALASDFVVTKEV